MEAEGQAQGGSKFGEEEWAARDLLPCLDDDDDDGTRRA